MLTVACVWTRGNVPYGPEYVERLRSMVGRNLDFDRFVCLTDRPTELPHGVEALAIQPAPRLPGWWNKLRLFDERLGLQGRVLYLDLDVLVTKPLRCVADFPSSFAMVPHAGTFQGGRGLAIVPCYNTSVMVWDTCDRMHQVWESWRPEVGERLWGDQDWVGELMPAETVMPAGWFPRVSQLLAAPDGGAALLGGSVVVLCKKPKNHELAARAPQLAVLWK